MILDGQTVQVSRESGPSRLVLEEMDLAATSPLLAVVLEALVIDHHPLIEVAVAMKMWRLL